MNDQSPLQDEHPWLSLGRLSGWAWQKIFTKQGALVFFASSIALGMYLYSDTTKPWMILLSPLPIVIMGFFLLFLVVIVSFLGDAFAGWAIGKMFKSPNPKKPSHQFLYFALSAIGFVLAAIFLDIAIGDSDFRGYWPY